MVNKAIVLGADGQDGSYMCDLLVKTGYKVCGIVEFNSIGKYRNNAVDYSVSNFLSNESKEYIFNLISEASKDGCQNIHIYNFMGITDVFEPWDHPDKVYYLNFNIPIIFIEIIKKHFPNTVKFLQASSCLVFGNTKELCQNENNKRAPVFHYGIAKNMVDEIIKLYRSKYNLFLCSAVMYNHDSPRRGEHFFTQSLINQSVMVKGGAQKQVCLGYIDEKRDVGYAADYMEACFKIMNHNLPDDYVIGTGENVSMREIVEYVFNKIGLVSSVHLNINENLKREIDFSHLKADNTKIRSLGWCPRYFWKEVIDDMIFEKLKKYEWATW